MPESLWRMDSRQADEAQYFFHELKNSLAVLKGFLQMMAANPSYHKDAVKLDIMNRETDRMHEMALRYLEKIRGGNGFEWLEPGDVTEEVALLLQDLSRAGDIRLRTVREKAPAIWASREHLRQLILNLAKNGMEAMSSGGTLTIRVGEYQNHCVLTVSDEGKGFPPEVLKNWGDFSSVVSGKEGGSGAGLQICSQIITACQAIWQVESKRSGSQVRVIFPTEAELETRTIPGTLFQAEA